MTQTSDVVVVGGGIIGLAVAYYLAREQVQVTLVERGAVGREASWAAAGYLSYQGENNTPGPRLDLVRTSRLMYDGWIEELQEFTAADTGFWRCGLLELCLNEAEAHEMQARLDWQQAAGFNINWLDAAAVRQRQPHLAPEIPVQGGLLLPDVAQVSFARACRFGNTRRLPPSRVTTTASPASQSAMATLSPRPS
jgi:glycine oxidase